MVFCVAEEMDYSCAQTGSLSRIQMGSLTLQPDLKILFSVLSQRCLAEDLVVCCVATCHILCTVAVYLPSVDNVNNDNLICFYYVMHHFWLQHLA